MKMCLVALLSLSALSLASCGPSKVERRRTVVVQNPDQTPLKRRDTVLSARLELSDAACGDVKVKQLKVPVDYNDEESSFVSYNFQLIPAQGDLPTIVYIPGGPGQTSIGDLKSWEGYIPEGYGLLLTDPRGVGCNYHSAATVGAGFYQSEYVARDIIAAVDALDLENFSYYGVSYGTLVATMAGSISEGRPDSHKQPRSVILEGVLGRTFKDNTETGQKYDQLLAEKFAKLQTEYGRGASSFSGATLPLNASSAIWGIAIQDALMLGMVMDQASKNIYDVAYKLLQGAVSGNASDREWTQTFLNQYAASGSPGSSSEPKGADDFYLYIACQEVFPDQKGSTFSQGMFRETNEEYCTPGHKKSLRRFEAKEWPISAPIFYLQGEDDPATPADLALNEHYRNANLSGERQFLLVNKAGHNPFGFNMRDCMEDVWSAVSMRGSLAGDLASAVHDCTWLNEYGFKLYSGDTKVEALGLKTMDLSGPPYAQALSSMPQDLLWQLRR